MRLFKNEIKKFALLPFEYTLTETYTIKELREEISKSTFYVNKSSIYSSLEDAETKLNPGKSVVVFFTKKGGDFANGDCTFKTLFIKIDEIDKREDFIIENEYSFRMNGKDIALIPNIYILVKIENLPANDGVSNNEIEKEISSGNFIINSNHIFNSEKKALDNKLLNKVPLSQEAVLKCIIAENKLTILGVSGLKALLTVSLPIELKMEKNSDTISVKPYKVVDDEVEDNDDEFYCIPF